MGTLNRLRGRVLAAAVVLGTILAAAWAQEAARRESATMSGAAGVPPVPDRRTGKMPAPPAASTAQRDIVRVWEGPEDQPWLRIDAGGHTAAVRALAFTRDSVRLCSAGLDKDVAVWNLHAVRRDLARVFLRERTIRWEVARGLRGSIYALASSPSEDLVAIGGYGARGSLGDILLVDPVRGTLVKVLEGHRQSILSLAFSPDGNWLASLDAAGQAIVWKRGTWQPTTLYPPDESTYGPDKAVLVARQRKLRPIVFSDNSHVVLPVFVGNPADARLRWKLVQIRVDDPKSFRTFDTLHYGLVSALAASADGSRLASGDEEGNLYLWDLARGPKAEPLGQKQPAAILSLAFTPDGRTLIAGTEVAPATGRSQLETWDVAERGPAGPPRSLPDHVHACAVSPDGKWLAYVGGKDEEVFVDPIPAAGPPVALKGVGRRVLKVAFARQEPLYRVALGTSYRDRGFNDYADLQETFDPTKSSLGDVPIKQGDWLTADSWSGGWTVQQRPDNTLQLFRNNARKGTVALGPQLPGLQKEKPRCYCWLPDRQGKPFAIIVGTDLENSVYVCRLVEQGPCPILRHFRGHSDYVMSVGVSRDLQYVVSGAADGTIRFWSLAGYEQGRAPAARWGADFTVQGDQLVVAAVQPAGPVPRKGVRVGDVLREIRWREGQTDKTENRPAEMLRRLEDLPWLTQVVFAFNRGGAAGPSFQLVPAWQPLATLFVGSNHEWAFWTPEGYYDASLNGHRLFGWQVNRGLARLPDYYRADQFYKRLERPDVMQQLLRAGSLPGAFRLAALQPPAELPEVLPQQIAATPRIEILSPAAGSLVRDETTKVRALIELPPGGKLLQAKVFANGVVARGEPQVSERQVGQTRELTCEWNAALPRDERNLIQVVVSTDAPTAAFGDVVIERPLPPLPPALPKLYILAAAINTYHDPRINSEHPLAFPVADAEAVVKTLRERSQGLYTVGESTILTNEDVTPEKWQQTLKTLSKKLKDVAQPDDLLVLFMAGHGIIDEKTQKYYFVGYDVKLDDLENGVSSVYSSCITWDDFRALADVPCRKVALLDTCHSGAIQPPRSANLKQAVRELQEDVIFTITASTGDQQSAENRDWGHGAFTKCLLQALDGQGGAPQDGVVRINQVVSWVKQTVPKLVAQAVSTTAKQGGRELSLDLQNQQTPTAAPDEILPFTSLPLTRVKP